MRHPHGNTDGVVLQRQLFLPLNLDAILRTTAGVARQLPLTGAASKALADTITRQSCDNFCPRLRTWTMTGMQPRVTATFMRPPHAQPAAATQKMDDDKSFQ